MIDPSSVPILDPFRRPFTGAPTVLALDATPRPPRRTADGRLIARGVRPSAAIRDAYQERLLRLVDEMSNSIVHWLTAGYRRQEDRIDALAMAVDAPPAVDLAEVVRRLRLRWTRRFDEASIELARYFAKSVHRRTDLELRRILRRAGITVEFRISPEVRDALRAVVAENVSLIKSIPKQYLTQVEGSVMRSVLAGRDLSTLSNELQHQHGVTRRRAELISLQQNNSATGALQRIQYLDIGIERGIWKHSHAGVTPRPTHLANDGKEYNIREGWWDPSVNEHIRPGQLIHCRCWVAPILPR